MQGDIITYDYYNSLYINLTNRCTCRRLAGELGMGFRVRPYAGSAPNSILPR